MENLPVFLAVFVFMVYHRNRIDGRMRAGKEGIEKHEDAETGTRI